MVHNEMARGALVMFLFMLSGLMLYASWEVPTVAPRILLVLAACTLAFVALDMNEHDRQAAYRRGFSRGQ